MRARRSPALDASALASLVFAVFFSLPQLVRDCLQHFFDVRAIFILCLCFALKKPEISCVIKLSREYYWYRTQFIDGSAPKNPDNLIWFETEEVIGKTALIRFWKRQVIPRSDLIPVIFFLSGWCRSYWFFSGLKPLPLNFLSPNKVTVPRDPFVKTFESGTSELIEPALCEILCVVSLWQRWSSSYRNSPWFKLQRARRGYGWCAASKMMLLLSCGRSGASVCRGGGTPRGKNIYPPPPATLASSLR